MWILEKLSQYRNHNKEQAEKAYESRDTQFSQTETITSRQEDEHTGLEVIVSVWEN